MDEAAAKILLNKILTATLGKTKEGGVDLETFKNKFAFDVRLPQITYDSTTQEQTWTQSLKPTAFLTQTNIMKMNEDGFFEKPKQPINSMADLLACWAETNYMATERLIESESVGSSDNVRQSTNVYCSLDIGNSKNVVFSDSVTNCDTIAACQRSGSLTNCVRVEDSSTCEGSFGIIWSANLTKCLVMQNCYDMFECMFCSHLTGKQYYIANMPFEKDEYLKIKEMVIDWILNQ